MRRTLPHQAFGQVRTALRSSATGIDAPLRARIAVAGSYPAVASARHVSISSALRLSARAASPASTNRSFHASSVSGRPDVSSTIPTPLGPVDDADIVVVGGGVVGLALACGLAHSAIASSSRSSSPTVTLVEAADLTRSRAWAAEKQQHRAGPSSHSDNIDWENRVISLTAENMRWLQDIGVYDYLVHHRLRPIESMRVWDGLSGAVLDFDSAELRSAMGGSPGAPQISVMVEISNLQQALLRYLEDGPGRNQVSIRDKSKVETIVPGLAALQPTADGPGSTAEVDRDPWPVLELSSAESSSQPSLLRARLLVGADGPNSPVRKYAGIGSYGWPYNRKGLVGTLRCAGPQVGEPPVGKTAWQRFLPSGTIAFLPLSEQTGSMVWALEPEIAQALTMMHRESAGSPVEPLARLVDAAFRLPWSYLEGLYERIVAFAKLPEAEGQERDWSWVVDLIPSELEFSSSAHGPLPESSTGDVPPKLESVDVKSVASFPLQLRHADTYLGSSLNGSPLSASGLLAGALSAVGFAPEGAGQGGGRARTALVGDAAHTIHPLAGQGLNLGIADVRCLAEVLQEAQRMGADLGSYNALRAYPRQRYWENQKMLSAVDHLHWLYAGVPVPLSQQADGGKRAMERDGLLRGLAKEGIARGTVWARSTGMEVINELGFAKNLFMRQAGSTASAARGAPPHGPMGTRRSLSTMARRPAMQPSASDASGAIALQQRQHSSARSQSGESLPSDAYTKGIGDGPATTGTPSLSSLTPKQRRALDDMLRVDHSGEVAANTIYEGQADMFGALGDIKNRDMAREMWSTEKKHLDVMRVLLRQHNVRPSALLPVWALAGRVLGGVTALLGPRSAMACTEAVETVIGEHYDDQLAALASILKQENPLASQAAAPASEASQAAVHPSLPLLSEIIKEFRDDELEHLDTAVEHESQQAAGHALLSAIVAAGCKGAIWVAAKV
ncbi:putative ubiquinone biosynthesis monooxygenase [Thecaphora frezii]